MNVRATQSSSYAPLEVSWTPPSDGVFNITGYRIFYGSGQNISVLKVITSVGLRVDRNYNGETAFLRSEADHKYSELVNVTVGKLLLVALAIKFSQHVTAPCMISSHYQKMMDSALHVMQCALVAAQVKLVLLLE